MCPHTFIHSCACLCTVFHACAFIYATQEPSSMLCVACVTYQGSVPLSMPCLCHRPCLMHPHTFIHSCICLHDGLHLCPLTHSLIHSLCCLCPLSMAVCPHQ